MRLNLGCGRDYKADWVNLDLAHGCGDVRADIRNGLPFRSGSLSEIYASGVLEQVAANEQFRDVMLECRRVLRNYGRLTAIVPNARSPIAFRDPFDCRRFTEETWNYMDAENRYFAQYGSLYGLPPWKVLSIDTNDRGIMTAVLERR